MARLQPTKLSIDLNKREIIERAERQAAIMQAMIDRQVDSINRLLGHAHNDTPAIPMYESELMDLNDKLAKADVTHTALIEIITRVRHHAQDTANFKLLDIIGDVGKASHELANGDSQSATLGSVN